MSKPFDELFRSTDAGRDAFRARLFGLFSEEIVRAWCANEAAPYRDLGRPTLWTARAFATLDFTLQSRADSRVHVAEQKGEMAFEGGRRLRLDEQADLAKFHTGRAFRWFLDVARDPASHDVRLGAKPIEVHGAILVWGAVTDAGRQAAILRHGFEDVLSVEAMVDDLRAWGDKKWPARVQQLRDWARSGAWPR